MYNKQVHCEDSACDDLNMYCPLNYSFPDTTSCSLTLNGNRMFFQTKVLTTACTMLFATGSTDISVYAENGLSDVQISNMNETKQDVTVFCGDAYASKCKLSPFYMNQCMEAGGDVCGIMHKHSMNTTAPRRVQNIFDIIGPSNDAIGAESEAFDGSLMAYIDWICQDRLLILWIAVICIMFILCFGGWNIIKARRIGKKRELLQMNVDSDSDVFRMSDSEGGIVFDDAQPV